MIANCPECKKVFTPKPGLRLCYACSIDEQEAYQKVYGYVLKRPGSDIEEVSAKTGVAKDAILKLMKQGRIQQGQHIKTIPSCSRCSAILSEAEAHGREGNASLFCRICSKIMAGQLLGRGPDAKSIPAPGAPFSLDLSKLKPSGMHGSRRTDKRYGIGSNRG